MPLINGSHDHAFKLLGYSRLLCGMNVTSTIAVSCLVATSSSHSESLPNDGEKSNQPKRFFPKCDYG